MLEIKVPFFDAKAAYQRQKKEIDSAVNNVLSNGIYINGPQVTEFVSNLATYLDIEHIIPCGNGTDALYLALMALNLSAGDEVIVPSFNFIAAAEAIALLKLKPVFVDVDEATFNIDCISLERNITEKTKAIIVVHLFGLAAEMDKIMAVARKNNLFVIEDVAQSFGGIYKNKKLGTIGHIGCTSFFPTKNLACFGDGGAVFTNNLDLAKKIKMLASHGQQKKYEHIYVGLNSRLDTIQAAVLNIQLKHLDELIERRIKIATYYQQNLKEIKAISFPKYNQNHTYNQFCFLLENRESRDSLRFFLAENGVETMIYYSKPSHLQIAFNSFGYKEGDLPIAEKLCGKILALPIYPELNIKSQTYIVDLITNFFNEIE